MTQDEPDVDWLNVFIFSVVAYTCTFAQARVTFFRDLLGSQIDFLPGLIVYGSLAFPSYIAVGCAAVFGLLYDSLSANALGTMMATLVLLSCITLLYREVLLSNQFTTHWVLGLAASGLAPVFALFILYIAGEQPLVGTGTLWQWAIMTAGGGVVTPLWFRLFNRVGSALHYKEVPESTFRQDREIARGRR
jgi:rod shape-determining protein MreD